MPGSGSPVLFPRRRVLENLPPLVRRGRWSRSRCRSRRNLRLFRLWSRRRCPMDFYRRPDLGNAIKQFCLDLWHPHTSMRRRISRQIPRVQPRGSIEPQKMFHRRLHELRSLGDRHIRIRIADQRFAVGVHDPPVKRGEMVLILLQHLEIARWGEMPRSATADRRFVNDLPVLQQKGLLEAEVDINSQWGNRSSGDAGGKKEDDGEAHAADYSKPRA